VGDPFGTAALRAAVLDAWASSPTRFREDANTEEDLRLGGYADAWLVELAQNAADAARAAGVPGRLLVHLVGDELRVANTGVPLDAAGVAALASLRASTKRDDPGAIGLFGVGFAAVLPLSAAPLITSAGGGVAFSAARTAAAVAGLPGPAAELARRGEPPVLRLAWDLAELDSPVPPLPPDGYDTEVRLPLRPGVDGAALLEAAAATAADLLLALPDLVEVAVAGREPVRREPGTAPGEVVIGGRRWLLARRAGALGDDAASAQATEQRTRRHWSVCWALPLTADGAPDPLPDEVLHAPTPTTERLGLPARLIATVPVEPDRRRVRPGAATDAVLAGAVAGYLDLVGAVAPDQRVALVPEVGFPRSELDGRLRDQLVEALRRARWLPAAAGPELAPAAAEWLDLPGAPDRLRAQLAEAGFDRLLAAAPAPPPALGVARLGVTELVVRLFGIERPPAWWRALYAELELLTDDVPGLLDELRALPVPLVDDRTAAGPATVLLPGEHPDDAVSAVAALGLPGLYIAHPDALHPLLTRLGARAADPAALLAHPALREAVDRSLDDAEAGLDGAALAAAVLGLVAAGGADPQPGLTGLALPDEHGRWARADELVLPDAVLRPLLSPDVGPDVLDAGWAARFDRAALTAVGVVDGFGVVVDEEPHGPDHDLHDEDDWWDGLDRPPARLLAVRDLDLVDDDRWPRALALLAGRPQTRAALLTPRSYTAWWLARHARLGGRRPAHWRLPSAADLETLYDEPDLGGEAVDEAVLAAIGVRADLRVRDNAEADDLLLRLVDEERDPDVALVARAHAALSASVADGAVSADDLVLPERVRATDGSVVDVDLAVVLDDTWLGAVLPADETVVGGDPLALAELLDLPLASEVVSAEVDPAGGRPVRWSALPEVVLACDVLGVPVPPGELVRHEELVVVVARPRAGRFVVPAWRDGSGRWHASDPLRALLGLLAGQQPGTDQE
jgi:hypothetical protein